jgi:hypothetical protein
LYIGMTTDNATSGSAMFVHSSQVV